MTKKSTTTRRTNGGPTYRTETTRYDNGSSKSVTRTGGNVLSSGKVTSVSRSDGKGNTRTTKY